jgi:FAD/FMN-containing dehydrogenase
VAGLVVHLLVAAAEVIGFSRDYLKQTPDAFTCWMVIRKAPPLPAIPVEFHGREILALGMCYAGPIEEGERLARPLREFGKPVADMVGSQPYAEWQKALDPLLTPGMRNYWKSHEFADVTDELVPVLLDYVTSLPDPQTEIALAQLGRAVTRVPADATAFGRRDAQYIMNVHGRWADPAKDGECIAWARDLYRATAKYATGSAYVNFMTEDETDRVRAAYGDNYPRLATLKRKYDPKNLFRMNHNIPPAA